MSASTRLQAAALLLSAWMGAALLTVVVVAPGAFAVLPSRTLAGVMVGRVLPIVFGSGLAVGVAVALLSGWPAAAGQASKAGNAGHAGNAVTAGFPPGRAAAITALLASAACALAQFGINPRLQRLRADLAGPVDALSLDDPRRVAFGLLHGYSVLGLGVAMLAGAVSLGFLLYALRPRG